MAGAFKPLPDKALLGYLHNGITGGYDSGMNKTTSTIKRIKAGNYVAGHFHILRINELWLVWNSETQTRTARFCPNSKWFADLATAKTYVLEQSNKAGK